MKKILRLFILLALIISPKLAEAAVSVTFTGSPSLTGCDSVFLFFTPTVTGCSGGTSYQWTYSHPSSGFSFTSSVANYMFNRIGSWDVQVIATCGGQSDTELRTGYVNVTPPPVVGFTTAGADTGLVCGPRTVNFINTTPGADTTCGTHVWRWIISGPFGTRFYTTTNITQSFSTPGRYSVTLLYNAGSCGCFGSVTKTDYIIIDSPATACFTSADTVICTGSGTANFSSACSRGAYSYVWDFGDGSGAVTTTSTTTSHFYSGFGYYGVRLIAFSAAGCPDTAFRDSVVYSGNLAVTMSAAPDSVCFGTPVTFRSVTTSGGPATAFYWSLYDAGGLRVDSSTTADSTTFSFTYASSGRYTVADSIVDAYGCSAVAYRNIYVRSLPVVDTFFNDSTFKCTPSLRVRFTGVARGDSPLTYTWAFSSATTATTSGVGLFNPSYTYTATGVYTPTLSVTDRYGCKSDNFYYSFYSVRIGTPSVNIFKDLDSGCANPGLTVTYQVRISPVGTAFVVDSVSYGDTTSPPCVGAAGCADSFHTYTTAGIFPMVAYWRLPAYLGGCSGTDTSWVKVGAARPDFNLVVSPSDSVCPGTTVLFRANCTNCTSYSWSKTTSNSTGDTSSLDANSSFYGVPSPAFPTGRWPWRLIMSFNGCTDTVDSVQHVWGPVSGTISGITPNCNSRRNYRFTLSGATGATSFNWSVLNSTGTVVYTTTTASNILTYTFGTGINFRVTATELDSVHGCTNTSDTFNVIIGNSGLTWRQLKDTVCAGQVDSFFGPLTITGEGFRTYYWHFGDGTILGPTSDTAVAHIYTAPGTYYDTVIVVNASGCRDTARRDSVKVVGMRGGIRATPTTVCLGDLVNFVDSNTDAVAITNTHDYIFNSIPYASGTGIFAGGTSTSVYGRVTGRLGRGDTSVRFPFTGDYTVTLNDTDVVGCTSSTSIVVRVVKPTAYFTSSDGNGTVCIGLPVVFNDTNTRCTYSWSFDGGTTWTTPSAAAQSYTYTFTTNGFKTIKCAISADGTGGYPAGCSDTMTRVNYINVAPLVVTSTNFGDSTVISCPPLRIIRYADTPFLSYTWRVNPPGTTFSGALINTTIYGTGTYSVTLIGTNARGCTDSARYTYSIGGPKGYLSLRPSDSGCVPYHLVVKFTDTGGLSATEAYIWNTCPFGALTTTADSIELDYTTAGTYCPPTLVLQSGSCVVNIGNLTDSIRVYPLPTVSVVQTPPGILCYGGSATLVASGADSYSWSPTTYLDDPTIATPSVSSASVTTTYVVTGTTIHGCVDTQTVTVVVNPAISITITGRDSVCIGRCDTLIASGVTGASYVWTGVGTSCAVCDTNVVCITSTHTYTVRATDGAGCSDSTTFKVTVNPAPVLRVTPDPAFVCQGIDTTHLYITGAQDYIWRPRLGLSCDSCADPLVTITSNIIYSVTGISKFGCLDSIIVPVTHYDTTDTWISADTSICRGDVAHLSARGGIGYLWKPGSTLDDPTSYRPNATPVANTTYTVYIKENVCFNDTLTVNVRVVQIPVLTLPPSVTIIAGNSVQLFANYGDTANSSFLTSFLWTPSDSTLTCFDCPRPIATPANTTTYSVTASTNEGCSASGSVTINVICNDNQIFIPNTFTPNGDGVNDRFYISGRGLGVTKKMAIYNRWGELVYEANNVKSNDPGVGWDGTVKGQVVAPDVFIYVVEVLCSTGESFIFRGDISMVR
ncbi:MAG: PKD domain-containing protein [Taibaiella sp.]|nr:PKD domain-containing protein [Taibaiella sp.]